MKFGIVKGRVLPHIEWGLRVGQATKLDLLNVESGREPWPGAVASLSDGIRRTLDKSERRRLHEQGLYQFRIVAKFELDRRERLEA